MDTFAALEEQLRGPGTTDYEIYMNTHALLGAQKALDTLAVEDELMFQIVHQGVELWMKLIAWTMHQAHGHLERRETHMALNLFRRIEQLQQDIIRNLTMLNTMSPMDYQVIRVTLGNGSVRESPTYKAMFKMHRPLWNAFNQVYLQAANLELAAVYAPGGEHHDAYRVAEALITYDEMFQKFRFAHIQLLHRTIGPNALSLKGLDVNKINDGLQSKLFPQLWQVRSAMTDDWNAKYGAVRPSLSEHEEPESGA
jgi:tryptophan 2,3-dioxygenase